MRIVPTLEQIVYEPHKRVDAIRINASSVGLLPVVASADRA